MNVARKESIERGRVSEVLAMTLLRDAGVKITPATSYENRVQHFDFTMLLKWKVDVKAMKKLQRSDKDVQDNFHFVELKNITGGKGWLYGQADAFAFELHDRYLLVPRLALVKFVEEHTSDERVKYSKDCLYKRYGRWDRQDEVTMVKRSDLEKLSVWTFKKK